MPRFRKLPVEVEAIPWTGDNFAELIDFLTDDEKNADTLIRTSSVQVWNTLEGCYVTCPEGHWIIRGVKGELYPCDPDVLAQTYEAVD